MGSGPDLPGSLPRGPQRFEIPLVTQRIHGPPIAVVLEGSELPVGGKLLHRLALPLSSVARADIVQRPGLQHKKPAVDPTSAAGGFLAKLVNAVSLADVKCAVAPRGLHGRDCR